MSNETVLDWLALNVHKWPEGKHEVLVCWPRNVDTLIWSSVLSDAGWITKDQWLARRAELQSKPEDWPKDANWLAQDRDGEWNFYTDDVSNPPQNHGEDNWYSDDVAVRSRRIGEVLGDWRDTLEKRPEEFKPFASIEDNQELSMTQQQVKQDNGWFERGELPPVGIECEAKKYGKEEYYKVVICGAGQHLGLAVSFYEKQKGSGAFTCSSAEYFRPIRTERDVLLSVIVEEMNHYDTDGKLADSILAAGFSLRAK